MYRIEVRALSISGVCRCTMKRLVLEINYGYFFEWSRSRHVGYNLVPVGKRHLHPERLAVVRKIKHSVRCGHVGPKEANVCRFPIPFLIFRFS